MAYTYSSTGANTINGGVNQVNEQRALTSGVQSQATTNASTPTNYSVSNGDTMRGIANRYSTTVDKLKSANTGVNLGITSSVQPLKAYSTPAAAPQQAPSWIPADYSQTMTPGQVSQYAQSQAQNKYAQERLGYQQQIDSYNQKMGQLYNDDQMRKMANDYGYLKYADSVTALDNSSNTANAGYQNQLLDLNRSLENGRNQLYNNGFQQKQNARQDISDRGLYYSSILDNRMGDIDRAQTQGLTQMSTGYQDNLAKIDNEMSALMNNLSNQRYSLTRQQQTDIASRLDDLTKERNDTKAQYQLSIDQQNQNINQAGQNKISYQDQLFQDMYGNYADMYRQDRDFNEQKRQFDLEYALKKQQARASASTSRGPSYYGNPGGDNNPAPTNTDNGLTPAQKEALNIARGGYASSTLLSAGKGPITNDYYEALQHPSVVMPKNPYSAPDLNNNPLMNVAFPWKTIAKKK